MNHADRARADASSGRPLAKRSALPVQVEAFQVFRPRAGAACNSNGFLGIVFGEADPSERVAPFVSDRLADAEIQLGFGRRPNHRAIAGREHAQRPCSQAQICFGTSKFAAMTAGSPTASLSRVTAVPAGGAHGVFIGAAGEIL